MKIVVSVLIFCILTLNASLYAAESVADMLQSGLAARKQGDFLSAKQSFEKALNFSPNDTDIMLYLGLTYLNLGEYEVAKEVFSKGLNISPNYTDLKWGLGKSYMGLKKLAEAEAVFAEAVREAPTYVDIWLSYAQLFLIQEKFDQAIKICERGLQSNVGDERLSLMLAKSYFYHRNYVSAIQTINWLILKDQSNAEYYILKGKILFSQDERYGSESMKLFDEAIARDPQMIDAYMAKADILISKWKFSEAKETISQAQHSNPNSERLKLKLVDLEQIEKDTKRFMVSTGGSTMSFNDKRDPWQEYYLNGVWKLDPSQTLITEVLSLKRVGMTDTGVKVKYVNQLEKWIYLYASASVVPNARIMQKGSLQIGGDLVANIFKIGGTVFETETEVRFFDTKNIYFLNFQIDQYISDKSILTAKMYNVFGNSQYYNVWSFRGLYNITNQLGVFLGLGTMTEDVNRVLKKGFNYTAGMTYKFNDTISVTGAYTHHQNELYIADQFGVTLNFALGK